MSSYPSHTPSCFFFCSFFGSVWPILLCLLSKWNKRDGKKQVQVLKRAKNPETQRNVNKSSPRDAVCNTSARRCEARRAMSTQALHTVDAAAACHWHDSTSCVVLCSAAPHCMCVCTFKTVPQEKSPLPAFPQTGRTLSSPPPRLPLTLSVSSHPVINSKQKKKLKKEKEIEQSIWLRPWWTQQEQLVLLKL